MDNEYGWMHATFLVPCDLSEVRPDKEWITKLLRQNPDLTGWPFFVDLWTPRRPEFKPKIRENIWEARMERLDDDYGGIDHWRIDAKRGLFYAARTLEDDTSPRRVKNEKTLEFGLVILRTAEIVAIALRFANYLCAENSEPDTKLSLNIKWTGLQDRVLSNWAHPMRHLIRNYQSHTDVVSMNVDIPLSSSNDQIVLYTQEILEDLFLCFDGWVCPTVVFEELVSKLLNRKL